ncbi:hypothetical protein GCM10007216_04370 [Thalassobacillus devorans]|uniref:Nuclear transport factor 2 family protein n=2 Tax=Thalassobacillus devorans TaxID=279813 RepID=A0ABQ1NH32_9BACI|nr:hypothetical protein [Thalassobacillus devorans]NIK27345.1 hypothetical protein [Thalassobacillus devorans]GGC77009.1 hypothetical protein GCM10007216_04370 [Thalassobacillus devorans]
MDSSPNDMKLIIPKGCDNAPRKQLVIDFTVSILKQQNEIIEEYANESIIWYQLKDNKKVEGQCSLISTLQEENNHIVDCLEIYQVITHGKFASINGVITLANGTKIDFCDVYMFSNTGRSGKVQEIKSYRL